MRKIIICMLVSAFLFLAGCNSTAQDLSSAGTSAVQIESLDDLLHATETIVIAKYSGEYDTFGLGNGIITIGNTTFDDTSYYALCNYTISQVIQGDPTLEGKNITVREYLGVGEEAGLPIAEAANKYTDEITRSSGNPAYPPDPVLTLDTKNLLLCLNYDTQDDVYSVPIPRKCIHSVEESVVKLSSPLKGCDKTISFDSFKAKVELSK